MRMYLTGGSGLVALRTSETLDVELPDVSTMLDRLRAELENSWSLV